MHDVVSANPKWFDPDNQERIDEAIAHTQVELRAAQAWSLKKDVKAA